MKQTFVRKRIKAAAMVKLNGNWLKSFGVVIAQFIVSTLILSFLPLRIPPIEEMLSAQNDPFAFFYLFLPQEITEKTIASFVVTAVLYALVIFPMSVGICRFFIKVAKGEPVKFSDALAVYTNLKWVFGSVWLNILLFLISMFWSVVFLIVPILLMSLCLFLGLNFIANLLFILLPAVLVFAVLWSSRYSFAMYIYAEGEKGVFASLRECILITKRRKLECIILRASYFLWDIASTYIIPLGYVYASLSGTVYADYLYYFRAGMNASEKEETTEQ